MVRDGVALLTPAEKCAEQFLGALRDGNSGDAERAAFGCLRDNMSVEALYARVIAPAMWRMGDLCEEGLASVADAHLAAELATRVTASVHGSSFRRSSRRRATILLGGTEGERHHLGLRMAADVLDLAGHQVLYLGAGVPADAFAEMAEARRPDLVALSTTYADDGTELDGTIHQLREVLPETPILVGGRLGLATSAGDGIIPAVGLEDLVPLVDYLLGAARPCYAGVAHE